MEIEPSSFDAVQSLGAALISTAGDVMTTHGNDPQSLPIVAAGFAYAINKISSEIDPQFRRLVIAALG